MLPTTYVKILRLLKFVICQNIKRVGSIYLELQKFQNLGLSKKLVRPGLEPGIICSYAETLPHSHAAFSISKKLFYLVQ